MIALNGLSHGPAFRLLVGSLCLITMQSYSNLSKISTLDGEPMLTTYCLKVRDTQFAADLLPPPCAQGLALDSSIATLPSGAAPGAACAATMAPGEIPEVHPLR